MNHLYTTILIGFALLLPLCSQAQFTFNQDCDNAISLCNGRYVFPYAFAGQGQANDLDSVETCLPAGETNSSWYKLKFSSSGFLAFTITPLNSTDFNFALFNITGQSCTSIRDSANLLRRCSYAATLGVATGMNSTSTDTVATVSGESFLQWLAVDSGDVLALMVSRTSLNSSGFILDFDGTTATMVVDEPLQVEEAFTAICTDNLLTEVYFNQPIDSNSFSSDFSELVMIDNTGDTLTISGIDFDSVPNKLFIATQKPAYVIDSVQLFYHTGSDGNTIGAACSSQYIAAGSYPFSSLFNYIGTGGFAVSNAGSFHSFQSLANNVPFVTWYVDGALAVRQQASVPFNKNIQVNQSYRICMVAELGCNKDSTCQTVTYLGVGVEEVAADMVQLYPNPATDIVTISTPTTAERIEVIDMKGQLLFSEVPTTNQHLLNTSLLPNGICIVRVSTNQGVAHKKLVVAH